MTIAIETHIRAIITVDGEFIPACSSPSNPCVPELLGSDYNIRISNVFFHS